MSKKEIGILELNETEVRLEFRYQTEQNVRGVTKRFSGFNISNGRFQLVKLTDQISADNGQYVSYHS